MSGALEVQQLRDMIRELSVALLTAENQCQTLRSFIGMDVLTLPSLNLMLRAAKAVE